MPLQRLIREAAFSPEEVSQIVLAYDAALELLRLKDQTDAVKELIAKKVFEIALLGECDAPRICARALVELGLPVGE